MNEKAKELAAEMLKTRHKLRIEKPILFVTVETHRLFNESGMVIDWKEDHPGMILNHHSICGMDFIVDETLEDDFLILSYEETVKRLNELLDRRDVFLSVKTLKE